MNSSSGASLHTLSAESALLEVNIGDIVLHRDSLELTLFLTLAATNAGSLARFHSNGAFVLIHTTDKDTA